MGEALRLLEEQLGYRFQDRVLLVRALTHRSWVEERHPGGRAPDHQSQQRLEFLGDALLNYVIGRWLYERLPEADEQELTSRRKQFTSGEWLRQRGEALGLAALVLCGRGETANAGRNRKLREDTVEALLGAVLLDSSERVAADLVARWLPLEPPPWRESDPLVLFSEWYQARYRTQPPEPTYARSGSDHQPLWTARYDLNGICVEGTAPQKRDAKRAACQEMIEHGLIDV